MSSSGSDADPDNERLSSLSHNFGPSASRNNPLFIPELFYLIVEALGEKTDERPEYRNKHSLANLAATCKYFAATLETVLYTQDIKDGELRGLKCIVFCEEDHVTLGRLNKYPEELLKPYVDTVFNSIINRDTPNGVVNDSCEYTMLHIAAHKLMYDTMKKLSELGATWTYVRNFQAILSYNERAKFFFSYPAFQSIFSNVKWAPNLVCLIKKDRHACEILEKFWKESYPFVGQFPFPAGLLPVGAEDRMTLLHLHLLAVPKHIGADRAEKAIKEYPELINLPTGESQCSIYHIAVMAQSNFALSNLLIRRLRDRVPYFVDNQGCNPLHTAFKQSLQGKHGRTPQAQTGTTDALSTLLRWDMNPMMPHTMAPYQHPLLVMGEHAMVDWNGQNRVIKKNIDDIAESEKRWAEAWGFGPVVFTINRCDSNGNTLLGYITKAIVGYHVETGSKPLEDLFSKIVTEYGADINLDVNSFRTPMPRPYIHSIRWMANHASGRRRFKKLVNDLGGQLHPAEVAGTEASTLADVDFPPDQPHARCLPVDHPYALQKPFHLAFIRKSAPQLAEKRAADLQQHAIMVGFLVRNGHTQEEAVAKATQALKL
ncbi:hypothetical protein FPSE_02799 [Fusarium pseudograminearum CS3096]|uniref:Uncharacterized protein n=3 Tax=Fusarium pseudograminearum TaxID=101028 RepID=K3W274_FUSPC|nr:hypothetical protein FPSE_02799 [Fusarium pseudograminearum CS3096]EKJ77155.1 hypothetical protein FPSE_02799 [Fusarium pseudograminearum CS3096]KAF0634738.1 hypothetical protein FPSE5266_02799 [Fusarium pseudograminearum]CEG02523.1 unnamed protein product [Fusarium pseudograminearum CS3427]CEG03043.1 unnamed protein product [Fusarium pseudograminearum CS3487]